MVECKVNRWEKKIIVDCRINRWLNNLLLPKKFIVEYRNLVVHKRNNRWQKIMADKKMY